MNSISRREIIVHAHIFKNAGTTIDWILERNFGARFCDHRDDHLLRSDKSYLVNFLSDNKQLSAISSHSLPLPLAATEEFQFYPIVLLRHPLLRVRSVYDFEKSQAASTPGAVSAKKMSFPEYVRWRMCEDVAPTIRNMQVRFLTMNSQPRVEQLGEAHYSSACQFIADNATVGLVERFDESMVIFAEYLAGEGVFIDFTYKKQNVSLKNNYSAEEKIELLKSELGTELFALLQSNNELDMRLYNSAIKIVDDRFKSIANRHQLVEKLKSRCRELN